MKKTLFSFIAASALLVSCKQEEKKTQEPMIDPPVESVNNVPDVPREETAEIITPEFQYAEADQFAKEYTAFIKDYITASAHNDKEAMKSLGPRLNEFQKRGVELAKRVPQNEAVAFQDFLNSIEQNIK